MSENEQLRELMRLADEHAHLLRQAPGPYWYMAPLMKRLDELEAAVVQDIEEPHR